MLRCCTYNQRTVLIVCSKYWQVGCFLTHNRVIPEVGEGTWKYRAKTVSWSCRWKYRVAVSRVPTPPGKFWKVLEFLLENFLGPGKSWKMILVLESPWSLLARSWKALEFDVHSSFWFQIDMFMQTKIAIIVSIRYVVWAAGMPKCFHGRGSAAHSLQRSLRLLSYCLLLYLNIAGLRLGHRKMLLRPGKCWKSLEFFVTKRVWTLNKCHLRIYDGMSVCQVRNEMLSALTDRFLTLLSFPTVCNGRW